MPFKDLRDFIQLLEKRSQLARVAAPVSAELEITEITDRVSKGPAEHNRALYFEHVTGSQLPVLINAFGSARRMAWALGVDDLEELNHRLGRLIDPRLPKGVGQTLERGRDLLGALLAAGMRPKTVKNGPVQEYIHTENASLEFLPVLKVLAQ